MPVPRLLTAPAPMRPADAARLWLLFAPLAVLVALVRLIEFTYVTYPVAHEVGGVLSVHLPIPALLAVLSAAVFLGARARWPERPLRAAAVAALVSAALFALGALVAPWWMNGWLQADAFEFVRTDLLLVLLAAAGSAAAVAYARGWARGVVLVGVHLLAAVWGLFYVVEAGTLVATGLEGSFYMVRDFLADPAGLLPVLASEMSWGHALLLAVPPALSLLAAAAAAWRSRREGGAHPKRFGAGRMAWAALPFAALLVLAPRPPMERAPEPALARFIGAATDTFDAPADAAAGAGVGFDTNGLTLAATDSTRRKNVVVIVLESVRARSTGLHDPALDTTPFLDSLAQHGLLVEQMYAPVSYTNKTLVSLFGGIYPSPEGHVLEGEAVPGAVPARGLPALLADHGYRSAFFTPAVMAFERKDVILDNLGFAEHFGDAAFDKEGFTQKAYFGYEDRVALASTLGWVDAAVAAGDPFLLGFLTLSSHHPYDTPPGFPVRDYGTGDARLDAYLNSIRYTDAFVRDLVAGFAERGLMEETLFVIVGDHGEAFGEHGQRTHGDVIYDEALHVPAVLYGPSVLPAPGRVAGARHAIDVVPTVLDALGFEARDAAGRAPGAPGFDAARATLPGRSLLLPPEPGRTLFHAKKNARSGLAARRDSLKFLYRRRRAMEVFNTAADPGERRDVAAELPEALLADVRAELLVWYHANQQAYRRQRQGQMASGDVEAWRVENHERYERGRTWETKEQRLAKQEAQREAQGVAQTLR